MKKAYSPQAMASMGAGGAFVIVLVWILNTHHVTVPDYVGIAFGVLATNVFHYLTSINALPSPKTDTATPAATESAEPKKDAPSA